MWLVFLPIHLTNFTQWCLREAISLSWTECLHAWCCKDDLNSVLHTWTPNLYGFLPCKSLEVTYGSVKIIFETKINCFAFSEPQKYHFVCKTTKNNFSDRITSAHAIISCCHGKYQNPNDFWAVSECFQSSFKTTFCSFSRVSKHFLAKWVTNSFSSANFVLISEKWLWPLEYPFKNKNFILENTKTKFGRFLFIDWDGFLIYFWNLSFA